MLVLQRLLIRLAPYRWRDTVAEDLDQQRDRRLKAGQGTGLIWLVKTASPMLGPLWLAEIKSHTARVTGVGSLQIVKEAKTAVRSLKSNPFYAAGLIGSLALGLGVTTVAFAVLDAAYLRPFEEVDTQSALYRLRLYAESPIKSNEIAISADWLERVDAASDPETSIAGYAKREFIVTSDGMTQIVLGSEVTPRYFETLGVSAHVGTLSRLEKPTIRLQTVVSHRLWERLSEANGNILGREVLIDGDRSTIVGVTAPGFRGIDEAPRLEDVWVLRGVGELAPPISTESWRWFARLAPESAPEAQKRIGATVGLPQYPVSAQLIRLRRGDVSTAGFVALNGAAVLVLLLACLNASNLAVAGLVQRLTQWRVRIAIGASRWDLVRYKLIEDTIVSLASALAGLVLAIAGVALVRGYLPLDVRVDQRALVAAFSTAILLPPLFGLLPTLGAIRKLSFVGFEAPRGTRRHRLFFILVALQSGVALGFLASGAQFFVTLSAREGDDGVQRPEQVLVLTVDRSSPADDGVLQAYSELLDAIRQTNSTFMVGFSCDCELWQPVTEIGMARASLTSDPGPPRRVAAILAGQDFLQILGLDLAQGRMFDGTDLRIRQQYVVVNTAFARAFDARPLVGRELTFEAASAGSQMRQTATIVGIVEDPVNPETGKPAIRRLDRRPTFFYTAAFGIPDRLKIYVRATESAQEALGSLAATLKTLSLKSLAVRELTLLSEVRQRYEAPRRWIAQSIASAGIVALILGTAGIFSLVSYQVSRSAKEIALRIALGSTHSRVSLLFVRRAFYPVLTGCLLGMALAWLVLALTRSAFNATISLDPFAFLGSWSVLLAAMLAAAVVPALRGVHVRLPNLLKDN